MDTSIGLLAPQRKVCQARLLTLGNFLVNRSPWKTAMSLCIKTIGTTSCQSGYGRRGCGLISRKLTLLTLEMSTTPSSPVTFSRLMRKRKIFSTRPILNTKPGKPGRADKARLKERLRERIKKWQGRYLKNDPEGKVRIGTGMVASFLNDKLARFYDFG